MANRLPKKILRSHKLNLANNYGATASIWVPDEENSRYKPKVCLSFKSGGGRISMVFDSMEELTDTINGLAIFCEENSESVNKALNEAVLDWSEYKQYRREKSEFRKGLKLVSVNEKS